MTRSVQKRRNKNTMTDWEDLYHRNQLKSFRVGELEFYINHHNIAFKGKKDKKVWVVKAHIGGKILTSIVQDSQNNIQPASDSNSESENDSDRDEHIIGSSSNSSELNDSRDKAADSQQEQEVDATIPESSTSRNGRRRKRVL